MNVNEIGLVVGLSVVCIGAIELGKLSRQVSLLRLAMQLQGEELSKLKKEEER